MYTNLSNSIFRRISSLVQLIPLVALVAACGGGGGESERIATSVSVISPTQSLVEGEELQLAAVVRDQSGRTIPNVAVAWSSSDDRTAVVSTTGLVKTFNGGSVVLKAEANGIFGTLELSIAPIQITATVGEKEVVFRYATDRCDEMDIPDQPPRVVRAEDSSLVLFAGNAPRPYVSRGVDFQSFHRDCTQPVLTSADRRTPRSYENWEWIWVVYRQGDRWHALISNEFHDTVAETCAPGDASPSNPCWYNSITYAVSTDGAHSFVKPSPPSHVIAPAPNVWVPPDPGTPPLDTFPFGYSEGYFPGPNIVRGKDGFFYTYLSVVPRQLEPPRQGTCPIRTDDLGKPASWRAWDGTGFNLRMMSPYITGASVEFCRMRGYTGGIHHVTFNSYLDRFVSVSIQGSADGSTPCGIYVRLSSDFFYWTRPKFVFQATSLQCPPNSISEQSGSIEQANINFVSLVDHTDTTDNFERSGRTAYIYYVRHNQAIDHPTYWLDRDVVRVPVTFTRND